MAYIVTQPTAATHEYQPGENLSWFEADSTNQGENSFNYTMRLQVTDLATAFTTGTTGADVVGNFSIPPRPTTGKAQFSPNAIAKNYVQSDFTYTSGWAYEVNGVMKYRITFGETYIDGTGTTIVTDNVISNTYYVWDSVMLTENWPSYDMDDYLITPTPTTVNVTENLLLTDGPTNRCIIENDQLYALVYPDVGNYQPQRVPAELLDFYGDWTDSHNFGTWSQSDESGTASWVWGSPGGTLSGIPLLGTNTKVVYLEPQATAMGTGPIWEDDSVFWKIETSDAFGLASVMLDLKLWGKETNGNWVSLATFTKVDSGGFLAYQYSGSMQNSDYLYIGFTGFAQVGGTTSPTIIEHANLTMNASESVNWYLEGSWMEMPRKFPIDNAEQGKITYLNAGTDGAAAGYSPGDTYTAWIGTGSLLTLSAPIEYSNCEKCGNCEKVSITWLNSLGGYDTYEFNCLVEKELEVNRVKGERTLPMGYQNGQRGTLNSSNVAKRNKRVATEWTTQENTDWLESLFMSVDAYEIRPDRTPIPITINNNSYSQFVNQDKLKLVEFTYTVAYDRSSQIN